MMPECLAATADPGLKQDGRDWRDKRDWQGPDLLVTRVALFTLDAQYSTISRETNMNHAG
jgi:hypothetical protein